MTLRRNEISILLATARDLLGGPRLDIHATVALLKEMPGDMGEKAQKSVTSALFLVCAAKKVRNHEGVARYALSRVAKMLEDELV